LAATAADGTFTLLRRRLLHFFLPPLLFTFFFLLLLFTTTIVVVVVVLAINDVHFVFASAFCVDAFSAKAVVVVGVTVAATQRRKPSRPPPPPSRRRPSAAATEADDDDDALEPVPVVIIRLASVRGRHNALVDAFSRINTVVLDDDAFAFFFTDGGVSVIVAVDLIFPLQHGLP
jgi:hypothetical protein